MIQWCLDEAGKKCGEKQSPNARFIILDPNGEYSRVFNSKSKHRARVFKVGNENSSLKVPVWFWNSAEWSSIMQASAGVQRPTLRRALREIRAGRTFVKDPSDEEKKLTLRRYLSSRLISIKTEINTGTIQTDATKFGYFLKAICGDLGYKRTEFVDIDLNLIQTQIDLALNKTFKTFQDKNTGETVEYYRAFQEVDINAIVKKIEISLENLGGIIYQEGPGEDVPLPFNGTDLPDHLEMLAAQENVSQFLDFLISRIGGCQGSCHLNMHFFYTACLRLIFVLSEFFSGLSITTCIGDQFLVFPDHRPGKFSLASS